MPKGWIQPGILDTVDGSERFVGLDASVLDFWRWGFADLRMNVFRGVLAEFLVAKAIGVDTRIPRVEWENFDLLTADGTKIEVKSSAYLQSWPQKELSKLKFGGLMARSLSSETGLYSDDPEVRADVFVFAIHRCRVPDDYDPLDIGQWEFRVVPAEEIRRQRLGSVGLSWLDRFSPQRLQLGGLADAVRVAVRGLRAVDSSWRPLVAGEPVLFMGRGEAEWKQQIRERIVEVPVNPHIRFVVSSHKRRGHHFDLDNLAKPVLDVLGKEADSVWATVEEGQMPGVEISEQVPRGSPEGCLSIRIEEPPSRSVKRLEPLAELAEAVAYGSQEPLGLAIEFDSPTVNIADFGFEGPIKSLVDALEQLLGSYGQGGADYRIRDLRIRCGQRTDGEGVTLSLWMLEDALESSR